MKVFDFYIFSAALYLVLGVFSPARAQTREAVVVTAGDPRGAAELTVCSQNLNNYGSLGKMKARLPGMTAEGAQEKESALIARFLTAGCDVIALQELIAENEEAGEIVLKKFADQLRFKSGRFFQPVVGPSNDRLLRNAFLFAQDRAELLHSTSYYRVELPRISPAQKPRYFSRGPLEIQLNVKGKDDAPAKVVSLVDFHFKSKAGSKTDATGLEWETYRMEMSEALRRVVENRYARAFASGETILLLLGDRNSNFDSASAKILDGSLPLKLFQDEAPCRLSKRGVPLCQAETMLPQRLFSVLTGDSKTRLQPGTLQYKNVYSWIDDILMPAESLPFAWREANSEGHYQSGIVYRPTAASDHALVYVTLNW